MRYRINACAKCGGEGWLWWYELENYCGPATETGRDDTRYTCDECRGEPDASVLQERFDPAI